MNIVTLTLEEQQEVIMNAIALLKRRVVGGVGHIAGIDDTFLAIPKEAESGNKAVKALPVTLDEADILTVTRGVEESVGIVLQTSRSHITNPHITPTVLVYLSTQVMKQLNTSRKKKIVLKDRLKKAIILHLNANEAIIKDHEEQMNKDLKAYYDTGDDQSRSKLAKEIKILVVHIHSLQKISDEAHGIYDLTEDPTSDGGPAPELAHISQSSGSPIGWSEESEAKYQEDPVDEESIQNFQEDIHLSPAEKYLKGSMPDTIQSMEYFFQDTYHWWRECEDYLRDSYKIEHFPGWQIQMLEIVLHRKLLIYMYADQTLCEKLKEGGGKGNSDMTRKIADNLVILGDEIDIYLAKIAKLKESTTGSPQATKEAVIPSSPVSIKLAHEEILKHLYRDYGQALALYIEASNVAVQTVQDIEHMITRAHEDLVSHCNRNNLESHHLGLDKSGDLDEEQGEPMTHVDAYLNHPNFFEKLPDSLVCPLSESEKILLILCDINVPPVISEKYHASSEIHFDFDRTDDDKPTAGDLKLIESSLQRILDRKISIYFHASQYYNNHRNEEVPEYLEELLAEISNMQESLIMLTRRVSWSKGRDLEQRQAVLESEINKIVALRHHLLQVFIGEPDNKRREFIGARILEHCSGFKLRKDMLRSIGAKPVSTSLPAEPWLESEKKLRIYIAPETRECETELFGDRMPYKTEEKNTAKERKAQKIIQLSQHIERIMMLCFFVGQRLDEINHVLKYSQGYTGKKPIETLPLERQNILFDLKGLQKDMVRIMDELDKVRTKDETADLLGVNYLRDKRITYEVHEASWEPHMFDESIVPITPGYALDIFLKAGQTLSSVDGLIANAEFPELRTWWENIQSIVIKLRREIESNYAGTGSFQKKYDAGMGRMVTNLDEILTSLALSSTKRLRLSYKTKKVISEIRALLFNELK